MTTSPESEEQLAKQLGELSDLVMPNEVAARLADSLAKLIAERPQRAPECGGKIAPVQPQISKNSVYPDRIPEQQ